jgi:glucose/arabinose dehydrogenase
LNRRERAGQSGCGEPVGVAIDRNGGLLVADDVGNTIWRVTKAD